MPDTGTCHESGTLIQFTPYGYGICVQKDQHTSGRETIIVGTRQPEVNRRLEKRQAYAQKYYREKTKLKRWAARHAA